MSKSIRVSPSDDENKFVLEKGQAAGFFPYALLVGLKAPKLLDYPTHERKRTLGITRPYTPM
jgi:hypothetical protein